MTIKRQTLFLSHGGGPLPLLGDVGHEAMVNCLTNIAADITKPSAIIIVSAHWEATEVEITASATPSLFYDYYGFPDAAYQIEYPCQGLPSLAKKIHEKLTQANIPSQLNQSRGLDHGVFVPLKIMYPQADIPCVQVSLRNSLDPLQHIHLGQALQEIDQDNLLIIGSGFTFHNMQAFFRAESEEHKTLNAEFEKWLYDTCSDKTMPEDQRQHQLCLWHQAPGARYCHPREEHLLPLHVCYGAAGRACDEVYQIEVLNKQCSMYLWR